jgi:hypothetical protein
VDKPTNASIQVLQRELYANSRAIYSTRGGGNNGHLTLIMPAADYLARVGEPFIAPMHPGAAPIHAPAATSAQITETNRQFAAALTEHTLYRTVAENLKRQILTAVPHLFLNILADDDMGFADISCSTLLAHLKITYGTIATEELEANRNLLSAEWIPENPIEDLWIRIRDAQWFAITGEEPIPDATALRLTLAVFEKTGVFTSATERWHEKDDADWTMMNFKAHFIKADKERHRKITALTGGFHGAHAATPAPADGNTKTDAAPFSVKSDGCVMWYCWSHGLGTNRSHHSKACRNKKPGHQDTATVTNRMGGSNIILGGKPPPPRETPAAN